VKIELELTPAQLNLLREGIDELPLGKYITLVAGLLPQLPILEHVPTVQPLATRTLANGIKLDAYSARGASMLEDLDRVLCKVAP
jgi:hypothetical protein